jgi:hypothetical protein
VSLNKQDGRSDQTYKEGAADDRGAARMAAVYVPERMNELTDGTVLVRSVDAATGPKIDPYRKSRFRGDTTFACCQETHRAHHRMQNIQKYATSWI